jgi:hypothetical protein
MATGKRPVAHTHEGNPVGQPESREERGSVTLAPIARDALVVIARLLARTAAAEAVGEQDHEKLSNDGAAPYGR